MALPTLLGSIWPLKNLAAGLEALLQDGTASP